MKPLSGRNRRPIDALVLIKEPAPLPRQARTRSSGLWSLELGKSSHRVFANPADALCSSHRVTAPGDFSALILLRAHRCHRSAKFATRVKISTAAEVPRLKQATTATVDSNAAKAGVVPCCCAASGLLQKRFKLKGSYARKHHPAKTPGR
jgi:hypothetical protein